MNPRVIKSSLTRQSKLLILGTAAGVLSLGVSVRAAVPNSLPRAQDNQSQPTQSQKFQGEVTPNPDTGDIKVPASSYEMYDENHGTYFSLEGTDTKKPKPLYKYAGKRVEITGTLDTKTKTVHIESIRTIHW